MPFRVPVPGILLIGMLAGAGTARVPAASLPDQELLAAQQTYVQANNAADLKALDRLTADDWIGITEAGVIRTKAQFLEDVRKRGPARIQATASQLQTRQKEWKVRAYGEAGFVARLTAGDHGGRAWVTGFWAKHNGTWQRVFSQETRVIP
jgi:hypothetical protein